MRVAVVPRTERVAAFYVSLKSLLASGIARNCLGATAAAPCCHASGLGRTQSP
jgi:hypothetical protein